MGSRELVEESKWLSSSVFELVVDPAHGGTSEPTSELLGEARAAGKLVIRSPSTVTRHCGTAERDTHGRSAASTREFENPVGRGLGQWVLQVPRTQQLTARHRRFRKGAGMLHIRDSLTRLANSAYPFSVNLRNTKKSPYPPLAAPHAQNQ